MRPRGYRRWPDDFEEGEEDDLLGQTEDDRADRSATVWAWLLVVLLIGAGVVGLWWLLPG